MATSDRSSIGYLAATAPQSAPPPAIASDGGATGRLPAKRAPGPSGNGRAAGTRGRGRATAPRRRRRSPGWVPDQHGAWAMITVPILTGVVLGGPDWAHLPLLGLWWVGYLFFFAAGLWLKSRRKARYWPPLRAYGLVVALLAITALAAAPHLLVWLVPIAPLAAISAWCSWRRRERSLLNDTVTVAAAGLTTAVAYAVGVGGAGGLWGTGWLAASGWLGAATAPAGGLPGASADGSVTGWAWTWLVTLLMTAYFLGTILYIKTNIRERGNRAYLVASVLFHALWAAVAVGLAGAGILAWWHAALWVVLVARAWAVGTVAGRRERPVRPLYLGVGEIVASILVAVTLLTVSG